MDEFRYVGSELDSFKLAVNWRRYWQRFVSPFVRGKVLEVGAGLGTVTKDLCTPANEWYALEPDRQMSSILAENLNVDQRSVVTLLNGRTDSLGQEVTFDTILYIDVLEHIEDDVTEVERAFSLLKSGGHMVVLSPAHQDCFSVFDSAVGHFRRYDRQSIELVRPGEALEVDVRYLDSVGLFLLKLNRWLKLTNSPSSSTIFIWDRILVPISRVLDTLSGYRLGKSILVIWKKR